MIDWSAIKWFSPNENWGDVNKIQTELVFKLDDFRDYLGVPFHITSGTQGKHSVNSQHYRGNAVDIIIVRPPSLTLFDCYLAAERFDFGGLGLYPDWEYHGRKLGGMHVDIRPLIFQKDGTYDYRHARWIGKGSPQKYFPLDENRLKQFEMI